MAVAKERLDVLLVERDLADTRARAQALIRAGEVEVNGQVSDKPGQIIRRDARLVIRVPLPFVSRGGVKLAYALDYFGVDPTGRSCLDVGASTGGFTDALLQRGARRVFAVDVGRGQLAWRLRTDSRVVNLERTDIRQANPLPDQISLATIDVAFISLRQVLPAVQRLLAEDGEAIALVKPQFEAGRRQVGRGGIVRDPAVHVAVLQDILSVASASGWRLLAASPSPIAGAKGNREFLIWLGMAQTTAPALSVERLTAVAGADPRHFDDGELDE